MRITWRTFNANQTMTTNLICEPHCTHGRHRQSSFAQRRMRNPYVTFSSLWREKCWNLLQALFCVPYHPMTLFVLETGLAVLSDVWVSCRVTGSFCKWGQICGRCIYYPWLPPGVTQAVGELRGSQVPVMTLYMSCFFVMCVYLYVQYCVWEDTLRFLSKWLGSSLRYPPHAMLRFRITNQPLCLS